MNSTSLKESEWQTTPEIQAAQRTLVDAFTSAPVLKHFNPDLPAIVETDASDFALGANLSQRHEGRLHPVAFHSRKFTPAEINYDTCDKELLAIVDCFKKWRRYVEGANHQVQVITDHNNLELFMTTKVLNRRQAHWAQELAGYDFRIFFRPGKQNVKADYLSRRPEYRLEKGWDRTPEPILKPTNISKNIQYMASSARISSVPPIRWSEEFLQDVRHAALKDTQYQAGIALLNTNSNGDGDGDDDSNGDGNGDSIGNGNCSHT